MNVPIVAAWLTLTIVYPEPGTQIQVQPQHIIYYGRNIVSSYGQGSVVVIPGGKFVVRETPEQIAKLIQEAEGKDIKK